MPDGRTADLQSLSTATELDFPELGAPQLDSNLISLDELDDETMREYLLQRGFEMHHRRSPKGVISRTDDVKGKKRLTSHITVALRRSIQYATIEADMTLSEITEEALRDWLNKRGFRQPGQ